MASPLPADAFFEHSLAKGRLDLVEIHDVHALRNRALFEFPSQCCDDFPIYGAHGKNCDIDVGGSLRIAASPGAKEVDLDRLRYRRLRPANRFLREESGI